MFATCIDDTEGIYWISGLLVNSSTGLVISTSGGYSNASSALFLGLAADPSGKWLAATDAFNNSVHIMAIDPITGALTESADHDFTAGTAPNRAVFDSSGKYLYVINGGYPTNGLTGSNNVSAYVFDVSTGMLTPLAGSPYGVGQSPDSVTIAQP